MRKCKCGREFSDDVTVCSWCMTPLPEPVKARSGIGWKLLSVPLWLAVFLWMTFLPFLRGEETEIMVFWLTVMAVLICFLVLCIRRFPSKEERAQWRNEQNRKSAARREEQLKIQNRREYARRMREQDMRPVSAVLISMQEKPGKHRSAHGNAFRGAMAGMLFGQAAALASAVAASKTHDPVQQATFAVQLANGQMITETVNVGSRRYEELSALTDS